MSAAATRLLSPRQDGADAAFDADDLPISKANRCLADAHLGRNPEFAGDQRGMCHQDATAGVEFVTPNGPLRAADEGGHYDFVALSVQWVRLEGDVCCLGRE